MKIMVLPDTQVRPEDDLTFLTHIGKYLVDKQPDVLVCLGDFADMSSLSSYDVGKKSFEGRRYLDDVAVVIKAQTALFESLWEYNARQRKNGKKQYKPRLVMCLGNHEERIERAVENDAKIEGVISTSDLCYEEFGWEVKKFLDVVVIEGIAFSHYFTTGVAGRPASTAQVQLRKTNMSSISGHQQGFQAAYASRADGTPITSIIAGSCYEHEEEYLGPQGNKHWRGLLLLHSVSEGAFDLVQVPLHYLKTKYA